MKKIIIKITVIYIVSDSQEVKVHNPFIKPRVFRLERRDNTKFCKVINQKFKQWDMLKSIPFIETAEHLNV